jgi:hypothetical protein
MSVKYHQVSFTVAGAEKVKRFKSVAEAKAFKSGFKTALPVKDGALGRTKLVTLKAAPGKKSKTTKVVKKKNVVGKHDAPEPVSDPVASVKIEDLNTGEENKTVAEHPATAPVVPDVTTTSSE